MAYSDWQKLFETQPDVFEVCEEFARRIEDIHPVPEIALMTHFWAPPAALTYRRTIVEKIGGWKEWLPVLRIRVFYRMPRLLAANLYTSQVWAPGIGFTAMPAYRAGTTSHLSLLCSETHATCKWYSRPEAA